MKDSKQHEYFNQLAHLYETRAPDGEGATGEIERILRDAPEIVPARILDRATALAPQIAQPRRPT